MKILHAPEKMKNHIKITLEKLKNENITNFNILGVQRRVVFLRGGGGWYPNAQYELELQLKKTPVLLIKCATYSDNKKKIQNKCNVCRHVLFFDCTNFLIEKHNKNQINKHFNLYKLFNDFLWTVLHVKNWIFNAALLSSNWNTYFLIQARINVWREDY